MKKYVSLILIISLCFAVLLSSFAFAFEGYYDGKYKKSRNGCTVEVVEITTEKLLMTVKCNFQNSESEEALSFDDVFGIQVKQRKRYCEKKSTEGISNKCKKGEQQELVFVYELKTPRHLISLKLFKARENDKDPLDLYIDPKNKVWGFADEVPAAAQYVKETPTTKVQATETSASEGPTAVSTDPPVTEDFDENELANTDNPSGKSKLELRIEEVRQRRAEEEQARQEQKHPVPVGKSIDARKIIEIKSKAKLDWSSSDESIAIVSPKGVIKGITVGDAVISVKSADDPEINESINITVVNPVKKITLSEKSFEMPVDMTWSLTASVMPEDATIQKMEWSSSNEKIATVDENGVVSSHSIGSTKITAAATDGSNTKTTINLKVDHFDFVFDGMGAQTETLYTNQYGGEYVKAKTKNNCVEVTMSGTSTIISGGIEFGTTFSITPIKMGVDIITYSYGSSRKTSRVFVSPKFQAELDEINKKYKEEEKKKDITGGENAGNNEILFKGIPWGITYIEMEKALNERGDMLKPAVVRNGTIWTQIDGELNVGECKSYDNGLSFSCDSVDKNNLEKSKQKCCFFKVDCYFDLETSFEGLKQSVMEAYSLPQNNTTDSTSECQWEVNGVSVKLTTGKKYIQLTIENSQSELLSE